MLYFLRHDTLCLVVESVCAVSYRKDSIEKIEHIVCQIILYSQQFLAIEHLHHSRTNHPGRLILPKDMALVQSQPTKPLAVAQCLCGACEVHLPGAPGWVVYCHCSQCRRALSADYATLCGVRDEKDNEDSGDLLEKIC